MGFVYTVRQVFIWYSFCWALLNVFEQLFQSFLNRIDLKTAPIVGNGLKFGITDAFLKALDIFIITINQNKQTINHRKSVKYEYCSLISCDMINYGVWWQTITLMAKSFQITLFVSLIVNEPKVDHHFDDIAPNDTKMRLELIF